MELLPAGRTGAGKRLAEIVEMSRMRVCLGRPCHPITLLSMRRRSFVVGLYWSSYMHLVRAPGSTRRNLIGTLEEGESVEECEESVVPSSGRT